jgi:hypothetical protein
MLCALAMILSSFAHAKELEPLADFVRRNPLFMAQLRDSQMLVSRCSALYLVLSIRLNEMQYKKDGDDLIFHFTKTAENYEESRLALSKAGKYDEASTRFLQKDFAKKYSDITLANWKKGKGVFEGLIDEDLKVCADHAPYFKKLARNLAK